MKKQNTFSMLAKRLKTGPKETAEVRGICTIRCQCKGCSTTIDEYVKLNLNFDVGDKGFVFDTQATASVEDLATILNKEGWAVADGNFFCPKHAGACKQQLDAERSRTMQHPKVPINELGFSDSVTAVLKNITPSVEELLQTPPSDIYTTFQNYQFLGLTYEFNTRLKELGIAVEGTRFVPPEKPDFWKSAPSPSIDAEQKLTLNNGYDQLCLEEKYIAWFITGCGHRFFSWREERPDDWKESIDYIFDTFIPENFETIENICTNKVWKNDIPPHDKEVLHINTRHLYVYQDVLRSGLKKCGLQNHRSDTSLNDPLLQTTLIIDQPLPVKTINVLVLQLRLHTLSDIFTKFNCIAALYKARGLGKQSINQIIQAMEANGCHVEDGHFKAPAYYLDDGCVGCPVLRCDALKYRGSRCAAMRAKHGLTSDPALDLKPAIIENHAEDYLSTS